MLQFPRYIFSPRRPRTPPHAFYKNSYSVTALSLVALLAFPSRGIDVFARPHRARSETANERATFQSSKKRDSKGKEFVPGQILVRYRSEEVAKIREFDAAPLGVPGFTMPAHVERFDASRLVKGLRLVRVATEDTLKAVAAFRADPDVLYAEPDYIVRADAIPVDTRYSEMWALKNTGQPINGSGGGTPGADIDAELAWNTTTGSSSVVVGIIDTGVDITHPDLAGNVWVNPGESGGGKETNGIDDDGNGKVDDVNGWDFNSNNRTVYDGPGVCTDPDSDAFESPVDEHGTHVAGTIGASGNNGLGVTGINWQVKLMPLKFIGACGSGPTSAALSAINYAVLMRSRGVNIRVLSNSWGSGGFSQSLFNGIQAAGNAGILFVAAAGNDTANTDQSPHFPSNYDLPNIISVASTTRFDALSSFSNFGPNTVHLAAPGSQILSTTPENSYSFFSGTSMATPHVAGVAALVCAAFPAIPMGQLRGSILYSGDSLPVLAMRSVTGRRLNAHNALQSAAENDLTAPGAIGDLHISSQTGRSVSLGWTAPGDDGNSGQASLYEISFIDPPSATPLPLMKFIPGPAGSQQSATVNVPYLHTTGTVRIRTFDNAGNEGASSTVSVAVSSSAADPYTVTETPATGVSTGGAALGLNDDDAFEENYALPFAFPFFGQARTSVTISTNGALYFSPPLGNDAGSSSAGLNTQAMIAGMWDDLRTDRLGGDVFAVQPDANRIIFRWQGSTFANASQPINFEIELRSDGTIQMRYGNGNAGLVPVVGISAGEPEPYVVDSHTSETIQISLANAQTVTFAPRSSVPATPPANDNFSEAQAIAGCSGSVAGTTIGTTRQTGEPTHDPGGSTGGGSAWYRWQAPGSGSMTINTIGSVTNYDTVLAVYTGNSVNALGTPVARNDDIDPGVIRTSRVTFNAAAGTIYKIVVDGWGGATGNFVLNWTQSGCTQSQPTVQLSQTSYSVNEGQSSLTIDVTRTDTSGPATVKYVSSDNTDVNFQCDPAIPAQLTGVASRKCDYHVTSGRLRFAAGEATKPITLSIVNDVYVEGNETLAFTLSNPTGVTLGANTGATVTIIDNDTGGAANPIDETSFYVRQLYVDLLSREPDTPGLNGWVSRIDLCGQTGQAPPPCDRVTVGGDGFLRSAEFFDRQFFVLRLYRTGLGRILNYNEVGDLAYVSGFLSDAGLELNKQDLVAEIISRTEFGNRYNGLTNAGFVDTLLQTAEVNVPQGVRDGWVMALNAPATKTRAQVYREVSERQEVSDRYLHEAQVVSAYYGFFTRNPDGAYTTFLRRLDSGEISLGDLANAFINASEYRQRFGP